MTSKLPSSFKTFVSLVNNLKKKKLFLTTLSFIVFFPSLKQENKLRYRLLQHNNNQPTIKLFFLFLIIE